MSNALTRSRVYIISIAGWGPGVKTPNHLVQIHVHACTVVLPKSYVPLGRGQPNPSEREASYDDTC
jgi:hypothetical protein